MEKKSSRFEKFVSLLPLLTSLLMLATIALTYYTYFYDVQKVPQITLNIGLDKIDETQTHFIVKIAINIRNQSKSKVEVVANQGKLFGYNCSLISGDSQSTKNFLNKVEDTIEYYEKHSPGSSMEIHRNINCIDDDLIGFFQPFHNDTWMLPDETFSDEIITSIPKGYDLVRFYFNINYCLKRKNLTSRYSPEENGDINYHIIVVDEKDSLKNRILDLGKESDKQVLLDYEIINSGIKSELWLSKVK